MPRKNILTLIISLAVCGLGVFAFSAEAQAATYYVDNQNPSCNDTGLGTEIQPFCHIQKALDSEIVVSGDAVHVMQGIYFERIVVTKSGITIQGERGLNEEWLTIIDGSDVTIGWIKAYEIDSLGRVWKTTNIPYDPMAMIADGDKSIPKISDYNMRNPVDSGGYSNRYFKSILNVSKVGLFQHEYNKDIPKVNFWDGSEAYYGYLNGTTYIRFRNGDNPNDRNVRSSPSPGVLTPSSSCFFSCMPKGAAVYLNNSSNVILKNFLVRGARYAVELGGENSFNNIIEDNYLMNGNGRVFIGQGAHDNKIRNNIMNLNQLGFSNHTPGPWNGYLGNLSEFSDDLIYDFGVRMHLYRISKTYVTSGDEGGSDSGIYLYKAGNNNQIYNNNIHNACVGIYVRSTANTDIFNNDISNISCEGIWINEEATNLSIYHNNLYNAMKNFRFQSLEKGKRSVYIYRNKFYNPPKLGAHLYFHFYSDSDPASYPPPPEIPAEIWIYHNSFSGGGDAFAVGDSENYGGLPGLNIINNVSSSYGVINGGIWKFAHDASLIGSFEYNWVSGVFPQNNPFPPWFTDTNIYSQVKYWDDTSRPDFSLAENSEAIDSGIDISQSFWIDGVTYPALPGFSLGYAGADGKPDMGAIQSGGTLNNFADINSDGVVNIKDIQACIKVITRSDLTYENQCRVLATPDATTNIKDIQVIIREIIQ